MCWSTSSHTPRTCAGCTFPAAACVTSPPSAPPSAASENWRSPRERRAAQASGSFCWLLPGRSRRVTRESRCSRAWLRPCGCRGQNALSCACLPVSSISVPSGGVGVIRSTLPTAALSARAQSSGSALHAILVRMSSPFASVVEEGTRLRGPGTLARQSPEAESAMRLGLGKRRREYRPCVRFRGR